MPKIAVVQKPPKFLDREKTILDAISLIGEAASSGASLVVFPEAYIPGYPAWIWRLRPGSDYGLSGDLHAQLVKNSVNLDGEDLLPLREAAMQHRVTVVCGMDERDHEVSRSTIYNTVVVIGPNGEILNRHRKLMPTNPERMVWGLGDASGLKVVETPCGRIGTLICWENYMPLSRYALYAQGIEVYIAPTYDYGDGWVGTLQHIAREGRCWVIGSGTVLRASDIPEKFSEKTTLYPQPEEWINPGDSVVIKPGGKILSGPMRNEVGILYGEIDSSSVAASRRTLDVAGHYSRPDVFELRVNRKPRKPVTFESE